VTALKGFSYGDIIHRCFRCGYCKFPGDWSDVNNCPPYARFRMETYSCGGRLWLTRAWLEDRIEWTEHLAEILYSCTTCRNCVVKCPLGFSEGIVNMITTARGEMVERGRIPADVKRILENTELYGNPYGLSRSMRDRWSEGLGIEIYGGQEYLFFVGCAGSYDTRAMESAKALGWILKNAGISFGVLGTKESCDGNEMQMLGESGLFEMLARGNISLLKERRVAKVITLSPHAYNAIRNYYPEWGGTFQVFHYTQILSDLVREGAFHFSRYYSKTITYHDPCFLGRWNEEYDAPRQILKAIPGVRFVEMGKNRDSALCCGGGGGNFIMDLLGGSGDSPARRRVREALGTGVGVLAVACPKCLVMLADAVEAEGCEDRITVKDISEIVKDALVGSS
jgi:Fe-S oxidoreductase